MQSFPKQSTSFSELEPAERVLSGAPGAGKEEALGPVSRKPLPVGPPRRRTDTDQGGDRASWMGHHLLPHPKAHPGLLSQFHWVSNPPIPKGSLVNPLNGGDPDRPTLFKIIY